MLLGSGGLSGSILPEGVKSVTILDKKYLVYKSGGLFFIN